MLRTMAFVRRGLIIDASLLRDPQGMVLRLGDLSFDALLVFAPFLLVLLLTVLITPSFLGSWNFSLQAFSTPDLARLNPISGLSRLISWSGLAELVKAIAKVLLVGGVAIWGVVAPARRSVCDPRAKPRRPAWLAPAIWSLTVS